VCVCVCVCCVFCVLCVVSWLLLVRVHCDNWFLIQLYLRINMTSMCVYVCVCGTYNNNNNNNNNTNNNNNNNNNNNEIIVVNHTKLESYL